MATPRNSTASKSNVRVGRRDRAVGPKYPQPTAIPPNLRDLPEWLLPVEAQDYLRLGRSKFYQLIREGHLRALRIGRHYRIHREELQRFAER